MEANYELCEKCEAAMEEAGVFGLTVQEMFEQKADFQFDMAFVLLSEGHYLARKSDSERVIQFVERISKEAPEYDVALIDLASDQILAYTTFSNDDIFAGDWAIVKVKEEVDHGKFEVDLEEK